MEYDLVVATTAPRMRSASVTAGTVSPVEFFDSANLGVIPGAHWPVAPGQRHALRPAFRVILASGGARA